MPTITITVPLNKQIYPINSTLDLTAVTSGVESLIFAVDNVDVGKGVFHSGVSGSNFTYQQSFPTSGVYNITAISYNASGVVLASGYATAHIG